MIVGVSLHEEEAGLALLRNPNIILVRWRCGEFPTLFFGTMHCYIDIDRSEALHCGLKWSKTTGYADLQTPGSYPRRGTLSGSTDGELHGPRSIGTYSRDS